LSAKSFPIAHLRRDYLPGFARVNGHALVLSSNGCCPRCGSSTSPRRKENIVTCKTQAAVAKRRKRRPREKTATVDYVDADGNTLTLRESLSAGTIAKIGEPPAGEATSLDDAWRRRSEQLFERLAVRWEIAGLPLTDQKMLLGRYRMADAETQRWVRETLAEHVDRHIPELAR
jgi:hypothetical protein